MNKLFLVILLAAVAGGIYFYLQPEDAKQWLKDTPFQPGSEITRVYKWRDADGHWQEYEISEYRADVNVLPLPPQLQE